MRLANELGLTGEVKNSGGNVTIIANGKQEALDIFVQRLEAIFNIKSYSKEEIIDLAERCILFFREEGISGERFADTIARLGFDYVEDKLLNSKMDKSKILEKNVVGGATC